MFVLNMTSNATNHGSYTNIGIISKMYMVFQNFLSPFIFLVLSIGIWIVFTEKKFKIFLPIIFAFFISLIYLFFLVNKDWGIYYISSIYLAILLLIPFFYCKSYSRLFIVFAFQFLSLFAFHSFELFVKKCRDKTGILKDSAEIVSVLKDQDIGKNTNIFTNFPNFQYEKIGLSYKNIHQIFGVLLPCVIDKEMFKIRYPYKNPNKYFIQFDFIVISKELFEKNKKMSSKDRFEELSFETIKSLPSYGYLKIAESKKFLFYQYQGDSK